MIPNTIHMLFGFSRDFGGKPFSLVHYLAVKSAYDLHRPDNIRIYFKHEPSGEWWSRVARYAELVPYQPPETIAGRKLHHVAHQADVARLQLLHKYGGIYLDMDVLSVRDFRPLRNHSVVMGEQVAIRSGASIRKGLCNAVIMAEAGARFIERWLEGFDPATSLWAGFRSKGWDSHWGEYGVRYPAMLARLDPTSVHVENYKSFFWPAYDPDDLAKFFGASDESYPDAYCHHLWEMKAWDPYLKNMTVQDIRAGKSPFSRLARPFL